MKYAVQKPFNDLTGFKRKGDTIELDDIRTSKLRKHGLIGNIIETQKMNIQPEKRVAPKETPKKPEPKKKPRKRRVN